MKTRSQTFKEQSNINTKNKRQSKKVVRLIDEYQKYTTGKYHGWNDTYDRKYDIDNNLCLDSDTDTDNEALRHTGTGCSAINPTRWCCRLPMPWECNSLSDAESDNEYY